jgi:hypothetical protein
MRGFVEIVGHLHGEPSARRELVQQRGKQRFMIGHPLKRGIGENEIERAGRIPGGDIAQFELDVRQTLARGGDHIARIVRADDRCIRRVRKQRFSGIARTAADIRCMANIAGARGV